MDRLEQALSDLPRHDASEWAIQEVLRRVAEDGPGTEVPPAGEQNRPTSRPPVVWIALAASLILGASLWFVASAGDPPTSTASSASPLVGHSGMTLKGASTDALDPTISLGLSLLRADVPVALVPGATARTTDTVLLRYTTDSSGFVYLFRLGPNQDFEVFHGVPTLPGTHHVTVNGRIVGYDLDGLSGEHLFGVAFSKDPWAPGSENDAAIAPPELSPALAQGKGFPRTIGDITVDARPVRMDSLSR